MIDNKVLFELIKNNKNSQKVLNLIEELTSNVIQYLSIINDSKEKSLLKFKESCIKINELCKENKVDLFFIDDGNIKNDIYLYMDYNLNHNNKKV